MRGDIPTNRLKEIVDIIESSEGRCKNTGSYTLEGSDIRHHLFNLTQRNSTSTNRLALGSGDQFREMKDNRMLQSKISYCGNDWDYDVVKDD